MLIMLKFKIIFFFVYIVIYFERWFNVVKEDGDFEFNKNCVFYVM